MMKYFLIITFLFSSSLFAYPEYSFSTVAFDHNYLYLAVNYKKDATSQESKLAKIDTRKWKLSTIPITQELKEREIIAIFPNSRLFLILSQWVIEHGDEPILSRRVLSKWVNLGKVECINIKSIEIKSRQLTAICHPDDSPLSKNKITNIIKLPKRARATKVDYPILSASQKNLSATILKEQTNQVKVTDQGKEIKTLDAQKIWNGTI